MLINSYSQSWGRRFEYAAGSGSNALGQGTILIAYIVPRKDLKPLIPWLLAYKQLTFLVAR